MNKTKIFIGVFLIFLLGVLVGSLGSGIYIKEEMSRFRTEAPSKREQAYLKRLTEKLELTERQQMEIGKILEESRNEMLELKKQYQPQLEAVRNRRINLIQEKLNDTQKEKWEEIRRKYVKRFKNSRVEKTRPSSK